MSDRLGEEAPAEAAQAWDSVRRVREPLAWALLVIAAIAVLVSAWQLFGLPGAPVATAPRPVAAVARGPRLPLLLVRSRCPMPRLPTLPVRSR